MSFSYFLFLTTFIYVDHDQPPFFQG